MSGVCGSERGQCEGGMETEAKKRKQREVIMADKSPLKEIPSTREILKEAIKEVEIDIERPSLTARKLERKCHEIYRKYEERVREKWKDKVPIEELEKSLSQSRVSRAGHTIELILQTLLDCFGIKYERNKKINEEQLDFVIPNVETLKKDPENAIIISVKREVRERWREVVGEAYILRKIVKIPDNIWFVSLFEPSEYAVKTMTKLNIKVYVPDEFQERFKKYRAKRFSEMFEELKKRTTKEKRANL